MAKSRYVPTSEAAKMLAAGEDLTGVIVIPDQTELVATFTPMPVLPFEQPRYYVQTTPDMPAQMIMPLFESFIFATGATIIDSNLIEVVPSARSLN